MSYRIPKRLQKQAQTTTHTSVESAIQAAVCCLVGIAKSIHYNTLLAFLRLQTGLTRGEVRKAVDSLAKAGRVRIQAVLGCILICDSKTGGVQ